MTLGRRTEDSVSDELTNILAQIKVSDWQGRRYRSWVLSLDNGTADNLTSINIKPDAAQMLIIYSTGTIQVLEQINQ
jgi:hypothetical protein